MLNALFLDPGVSGGVETYLHGLAPALLETRPAARITVATTRRGAGALRERGWPQAGIGVLELPCDEGQRVRRQLAEQVLLALAGRHRRDQVLHSLASIAPIRVAGLAHVITLHDVTFIHHETFNPITSWGMRRIVPAAARRADALIADGAAARDDVARTIGIDPGRFTVIPLGTDPPPAAPPAPVDQLRSRLHLGEGRLVVCVAALRPHKNQELLIEALPSLPNDVRLVLVGHAEPYAETLRAQARSRGLADRVVFAGRVADADLEGLWRASSVAAMPTLAEGFGLPLVEAMARGVPAAVSDIPVLREVGGDWPAYFDPHDPADAARAIRGLLDSPPDREHGRAIAARFTWPAVAAATWEVYDRTLPAPGN
jgi:glycosyltransferase involved in cell wall biosynthesis